MNVYRKLGKLRGRFTPLFVIVGLGLVFLQLLVFVRDAQAGGDVEVMTTADGGQGSLRWALAAVGNGGRVTFDPDLFRPSSPATIELNGELLIDGRSDVILDASNAGVVIKGDGLGMYQSCLVIQNSTQVTIWGLQIVNCPGNGIKVGANVTELQIGGNRLTGSGPMGQGNRLSGNGWHGLYGEQVEGVRECLKRSGASQTAEHEAGHSDVNEGCAALGQDFVIEG